MTSRAEERATAMRRYFACLNAARKAGLDLDRGVIQGGRSAKELTARELHDAADRVESLRETHAGLVRAGATARRDALRKARGLT